MRLHVERSANASRGMALVFYLAAYLQAAGGEPQKQPRPHNVRVPVPAETISIDDGDSISIAWAWGDKEIVRILGIDSPEVRHVEHDIPFDQALGPEASAFARGVFSLAEKVESVGASTLDPMDERWVTSS